MSLICLDGRVPCVFSDNPLNKNTCHGNTILKVSKSGKQISKFSFAPKNEPLFKTRAEIQKYFRSFFSSNKNFRICFRDLLTFISGQFKNWRYYCTFYAIRHAGIEET